MVRQESAFCVTACHPSCPTGFTCNPVGQCVAPPGTSMFLRETRYSVPLDAGGFGCIDINNLVFMSAPRDASTPPEGRYATCDNSGHPSFRNSLWAPVPTEVWVHATMPLPALRIAGNLELAPSLVPDAMMPAPGPIKLDVPRMDLHLRFQANGQDAVSLAGCTDANQAAIEVYPITGGYSERRNIPCTGTVAWDTWAPPGIYGVKVYPPPQDLGPATTLPAMEYPGNPTFSVDAPGPTTTSQEVVVNVPTVRVDGVLTLNGAAPNVDTAYCAAHPDALLARITFSGSGEASHTFRCRDGGFNYQLYVYPQTYDVHVETLADAAAAGLGLPSGRVRVAHALMVNSSRTYALDVATLQVNGELLFNGSPPSVDNTACQANGNLELAVLTFRDLQSPGDLVRVPVRCSDVFRYQAQLVAGQWTVEVAPGADAVAAAVVLPPVAVQLPAVTILAPRPLNVSLGAANVHLDFLHNGQPILPNPPFCVGHPGAQVASLEIRATSGQHLATVPVSCTPSALSLDLPLPDGAYLFALSPGVDALAAEVTLPGGAYLFPQAITVAGPASVALDVLDATVDFMVSVNGLAPQTAPGFCTPSTLNLAIATLHVEETTGIFTSDIPVSCDGRAQALLPLGSYNVSLSPGSAAAQAQANVAQHAVTLTPFTVNGAPAVVTLDEQSVKLTATLSMFIGSTGTCGYSYSARVDALGEAGTVRVQLPCNNTPTFSMWLEPGHEWSFVVSVPLGNHEVLDLSANAYTVARRVVVQ